MWHFYDCEELVKTPRATCHHWVPCVMSQAWSASALALPLQWLPLCSVHFPTEKLTDTYLLIDYPLNTGPCLALRQPKYCTFLLWVFVIFFQLQMLSSQLFPGTERKPWQQSNTAINRAGSWAGWRREERKAHLVPSYHTFQRGTPFSPKALKNT